MDTITAKVNFTWNNRYLDKIDSFVKECKKIDDEKFAFFEDEDIKFHVRVNDFKNDFSMLIIEDCKDLFGLQRTGKNIAMLNKKYVVLSRFEDQCTLKDLLKSQISKKISDFAKEEIQKIFAFRWLFCLKGLNENFIDVRNITSKEYIYISGIENGINYKSSVSKRLLDDWFDGSMENLYEKIRFMIAKRDISMLRIEISNIIQKYDKNLISWSNEIFKRLLLCV